MKQDLLRTSLPAALFASLCATAATVPLAPWLVLAFAYFRDSFLWSLADDPGAHALGWLIAGSVGLSLCLGLLTPLALIFRNRVATRGIGVPFLFSNMFMVGLLQAWFIMGDIDLHHFLTYNMDGGIVMSGLALTLLGQYLFWGLFKRFQAARTTQIEAKNMGCKTGRAYPPPLSAPAQTAQGKRFCRVRPNAFSRA